MSHPTCPHCGAELVTCLDCLEAYCRGCGTGECLRLPAYDPGTGAFSDLRLEHGQLGGRGVIL